DVHLRVAGRRAAAVGVNRLEDQRAVTDRQSGAAILLRNERAEVTGLGQLVDELLRILAASVELAPVLARIALADLRDAPLERALIVSQCERYRPRLAPYRPLTSGFRFSLNARTPSSRSSVTTVAL